MKFRRVFAALLTAALAVGMLAGCSESELTPRGSYLFEGDEDEYWIEWGIEDWIENWYDSHYYGDAGYLDVQPTLTPYDTVIDDIIVGLPYATLRSNTAAALEEAIAESEDPDILAARREMAEDVIDSMSLPVLHQASKEGGYGQLFETDPTKFDESWEEGNGYQGYFLIKVFEYDTKEALESSIVEDIIRYFINGLSSAAGADTADNDYGIYALGAECGSKYYGIVLIGRGREV